MKDGELEGKGEEDTEVRKVTRVERDDQRTLTTRVGLSL